MAIERDILSAGRVFSIIPVIHYNISCRGGENSLAQCSFEEIYENITCNHFNDLFITCVRKWRLLCVLSLILT